jgi:ferredoxin
MLAGRQNRLRQWLAVRYNQGVFAGTIKPLSNSGGDMSTQTVDVTFPAVWVDYDHCSYCGACVAVCPPDCLTLLNATLIIDHESCTVCGRCLSACPTGALAIEVAR